MKHTTQQQNMREGGQVLLVITLLLLAGSMVVTSAMISLVASQHRVAKEMQLAKQSLALAEGALEEVVYRHKNGLNVSSTEVLIEGITTVTTDTTNTLDGMDVVSVSDHAGRIRKLETVLIEGDGASFAFGVQTDNGGIFLENNSEVLGNIYSNGPIVGHGLNRVTGTAISAGPSGYIYEIHATGSMYAHEIEDSYAEEDAYYQVIDVGTVVDGTKYPGSPDLATTTLPISDAMLDSWADYASSSDVLDAECIAAGGTIVYDADVTLGPAKIPCDVEFEKFPVITIAGVLWIEGDVSFTQGPEFEIHPGIGNKSVPIIVDDPADRLTSGRVDMANSGSWSGNGNRSYLLLVSRNESAEQGGSEVAIGITNSTGGALITYAPHGEINMRNNTDLTEITAYRVRLENNTQVIYDTGLASAIFNTGPGGGYVIDSWTEVE